MAFLLQKSALSAAVVIVLGVAAGAAKANYIQTNLVSDIPSLATITDPELVNPWGVSHSSTSPFWVSNQGANTSTLYMVTGSINVSKVNINPPSGFVAIPTTSTGPQGPTGQANNTNTSSFLVENGGNGNFAHFIFANLNGTIAAWDAGTTAFVQWPPVGVSSTAVFTGLAINQAQNMLYAADNANGVVDVFDSSFHLCTTACAGEFATPPSFAAQGWVPFNVQDIGGNVYVTYAPAGSPNQQNAPLGAGGVAVFNESGVLQSMFSGGNLAAPWGIAVAPAGWGQFGGDLLVGNFSYDHSEINAFDSGTFEGSIPIDVGAGNNPGGLWALDFGIGGNNGNPYALYFTDGINSEMDGLFGAITVSEPPGLWLFGAALALLAMWRYGPPLSRRA